MAQDFEKSTFHLVDICDLLPQTSSTVIDSYTPVKLEERQEEKNFTFITHNIIQNKQLPFESNHFDFIQQNLTALTYKQEDWPLILKELLRVTKPGGYIQLIEVDLTPHHMGPRTELWLEQVRKVLVSGCHIEPRIACRLEQMLSNIGLVDIQCKFVSIPVGSWGLDIGHLWKENYEAFFESAKPFLIEMMDISSREYKKQMRIVMEELDEYKTFTNVYLIWGRVPNEQ